ncbi:hypothetical protein [Companilactobacillus mishanensis]|uniref:MBL fold metallo-hydrolase n=1 Tax=Companilactobacillus mishanensis TaxID=2486008 RepID=A0A5P0ZI64_9LACO|nr:hypothetical protein [Companilactobacillus mishanensis]MQS52763.1 hypothetical protein [Companilactobacillus mishanensis]MQS89535.1 hypothetical protein [Companilactobacillus mishanensis]
MTTVRFLNGIRSIEGNIVEIATDSSRIITDFGMVGGYTAGSANSLISRHILPDFPDLFSDSAPAKDNQAIVVTHVNFDNINAAIYLKSDIPIYISAEGYKLYRALIENQLIQPICNNFKVLPHDLVVGDLEVKGYPSDCDTMGSQSLLISDGIRNFGISGDVRLNGPNKDLVYKWIRKFKKVNLDLFMLDATAYSFSNKCKLFATDENDLRVQFIDLVKQRRDLIVININPFNVERLAKLCLKMIHYDRKMVLEYEFANVVTKFYPDLKLYVLKESIPDKKTLSKNMKSVQLDEIREYQNKFVLQNSFNNLHLLVNLKAGIYLHSNGFPQISYDQDYQFLREFLFNTKFQYIDFSASGHAGKKDLVFLTDAVNAQKTIPWHSYHPELAIQAMKDLDTELTLPKEKEVIEY